MHTEPSPGSSTAFLTSQAASPSLVLFTAVDGVLREGPAGPCGDVRPDVELLASRRVPVVLTSHHPAADLMTLQQGLGLRHPFICRDGSAVHVPHGYFADLVDLWPEDEEWHLVPLGAPHVGHAVRLLVSLFQVSGAEVLTVGVGSSWADRALLDAVDVPIIVRGGDPDALRLQRRVPGAYLTSAAGPAGWREAILGSLST